MIESAFAADCWSLESRDYRASGLVQYYINDIILHNILCDFKS
jgi:hypothetical protein